MPALEPKHRWYRFTPDRFVIGALLVICLLWLSDRFQWFGFNHHKGWTVLVAVAAVGVAGLVMLLWWIISLAVRRRFQFGIRSLLAFTLACSVAVSWLAVEMKGARRQMEDVESLRRLAHGAAAVDYYWQVDACGLRLANPQPPGTAWLRNSLGIDFFSVVAVVNGVGCMTDAGLKHLKGFTCLEDLSVNGADITDAGLECLEDLPQLNGLDLSGTKITDDGLRHMQGLTKLASLSLKGTSVTDAGLEKLTGLSQLTLLDLSDTTITDAGLEHVRSLTQLEWLILEGTNITDAGLKNLEGLTHLNFLNQRITHVTDAGLKHLENVKQLERLGLGDSDVTDAGLENLQKALPNCQIGH